MVRVRAQVQWEDCDRRPEEVFFESPLPWGEELEPKPDAFLLAGVVPAMDRGERRLQVEGAYCPELEAGLTTAFRVFRHWDRSCVPPAIEGTATPRAHGPRTPPRVASFMSGGVDSLTTLRANRLRLPLDHPGAIRDCLCVFGVNTFDFAQGEAVPARLDAFRGRLARLERVAADAGVEVIPVVTNARFLSPSWESWLTRGFGAGLAAVAHVFARRVSRALLASTGGPMVRAVGSNQLLDPHYSSASVEIRHDGSSMTRIEKMALIAGWPAGLAVLQPCLQFDPMIDGINCGRCRKCVRTMLHLAAVGALDRTAVFPTRDVTQEMIAGIEVDDLEVDYLTQALAPLERVGRMDLAEAVRRRLARHAWHEEQARSVGWSGRLGFAWRRLRRRLGSAPQ